MKLTKAKRLIKIINLLYSKRHITRKEISERCRISRRTVFRDLNDISELNVPVYYDTELRRYCLNSSNSIQIENWNLDEIMLMILGLKFLSNKVNSDYQQSIGELINKILTLQPNEVENILAIKSHEFISIKEVSKYDELINLIRINLAISLKKGIKIAIISEREHKSIKLMTPNIIFKNKWQIYDGNCDPVIYYNLQDVLTVIIL